MTMYTPRFGATVNRAEPTKTRWCGPGVLSVLSGLDYEEIESRINNMRGDYNPGTRVKGMMVIEMKEMLEELGLVWVEVPTDWVEGQFTARYNHGGTMKCKAMVHPTLIRWLRDTREARGDDVYMVFVTDHVMLVQGNMIVDNCLKRPMPYEMVKKYRRSKVGGSLCIMKDEEIAA